MVAGESFLNMPSSWKRCSANAQSRFSPTMGSSLRMKASVTEGGTEECVATAGCGVDGSGSVSGMDCRWRIGSQGVRGGSGRSCGGSGGSWGEIGSFLIMEAFFWKTSMLRESSSSPLRSTGCSCWLGSAGWYSSGSGGTWFSTGESISNFGIRRPQLALTVRG